MASVLLVDDEKEATEALKSYFDLQDIPCWVAHDGDQALRLVDEHKPDLVLLDVRLEGSSLSGLDVLKEVKRKAPSAKAFMVTGYDDPQSHARAEELGADGYLEKPLSAEKILKVLKDVTGQGS